MLIKVAEATDLQLDWLVAKCLGEYSWNIKANRFKELHGEGNMNFTTDWAQGGPIIEGMFAQGLRIHTNEFMPRKDGPLLVVASLSGDVHAGFYFGPTPLIAAMRCFIVSRLGEEVEVPDELA